MAQNETRRIRMATFLTPADVHIAAWRNPRFRHERGSDFDMYLAGVQAAERARFDLALLGDVQARSTDPVELLSLISKYDILEPLTVIAALAVSSKHIGLAATASTTYDQPYHIARRFASVDQLSHGRAAWNLVTTSNPTEAYNFGSRDHMAHDDRYARAEEFADVVIGLWNTWDSDAFIRDREGGRYFRYDALNVLNHNGTHFSVRGPLDVARSPQERPVIVQAGSSGPGQRLAARVADVVFTSQQSLKGAQRFYDGLKSQVAAFGRRPEEVLVICGMQPFVGRTRQEAQDKFDELQALVDSRLGRKKLSEMFGGMDFSAYGWDGPVPETIPEAAEGEFSSRRQGVLDYGRARGYSLDELGIWLAGTRGHPPIIGTGADIADWMEAWFREGGADGFLTFPYALPEALDDFGSLVVPELQRRGLFRTEYEGTTLRESLGLMPTL